MLESDPLRCVNLAEKFGLFRAPWSPKIVGEVNDCYVKLVKLQGEFVWHRHAVEDELFLVVQGRLLLRLRDRDVWVGAGEFAVRPRGGEHLAIAAEGTAVVLPAPHTTWHTGDVR